MTWAFSIMSRKVKTVHSNFFIRSMWCFTIDIYSSTLYCNYLLPLIVSMSLRYVHELYLNVCTYFISVNHGGADTGCRKGGGGGGGQVTVKY